jgi:hypothetical protein
MTGMRDGEVSDLVMTRQPTNVGTSPPRPVVLPPTNQERHLKPIEIVAVCLFVLLGASALALFSSGAPDLSFGTLSAPVRQAAVPPAWAGLPLGAHGYVKQQMWIAVDADSAIRLARNIRSGERGASDFSALMDEKPRKIAPALVIWGKDQEVWIHEKQPFECNGETLYIYKLRPNAGTEYGSWWASDGMLENISK